MRSNSYQTVLLVLLLSLAGSTAANAQTSTGEYLYSFTVPGIQAGMPEKQLIEAVVDVAPDATVIVDIEAGILVVRSHLPHLEGHITERVRQLGPNITLSNRTDIRGAWMTAE